MRTVKWNAFLSGLCGFAVALGVVAASARADVTTEKGASILVFPKVRASGTFDTEIQITNIGNNMVHSRCFYVNTTKPAPTSPPQWVETDFEIWLTKQQPTRWHVSTGRLGVPGGPIEGEIVPAGGLGEPGFSPGRVPPVETPFEGELKCVEVSESLDPFTGNHLKGEATIFALDNLNISDPHEGTSAGDVAKYNAIGIQGNPDATPPSNTLSLDGDVYDRCPAKLIVNFLGGGLDSVDPVAATFDDADRPNSSVNTELTLVPCSENFELQQPTSSTVQFLVFNELEQRFSASTTVTCYLSAFLTTIDQPTKDAHLSDQSIFSRTVLGTDAAQVEITPVADNLGNAHAVIGVVDRVTHVGDVTARAIMSVVTEGDLAPATGPETITLPEP